MNVDVLQNTDGQQRAENRRPPITEERQGNTRDRHQTNVHAYVDEYMTKEQCDHTHREQAPETVSCLTGDSDPAKEYQRVKGDHCGAAQKSFLLGNDGENEVIMCHGPR